MTATDQLARIPQGAILTGEGDCFVISATLFAFCDGEPVAVEAFAGLEDLVLAHGVVTGQGPIAGLRYGHAWLEGVEDGVPMAIDFANDRKIVVLRAIYYQAGNIDSREVCRYTKPQARQMLVEHQHYGPWEGAALAIGI